MDPYTNPQPETGERPPYRPPIGIPVERGGKGGTVVSVLLHGLVLLLLLIPLLGRQVLGEASRGAGGPGPAGGGGGGARGTGGSPVIERLRFIRVAPIGTAASSETPVPPPPPPPVESEQPPLQPPPRPEPQPQPPVDPAAAASASEGEEGEVRSLVRGSGGGSGSDGSAGHGPGSGGGVGSGVGTGRGSGVGPGTGGGDDSIYPPSPRFTPLPPIPVPARVRGRVIELRFSVNERGDVLTFEFPPTGDRGYDRRLREQFSAVRFRPATLLDGTPIAAVAVVTLTL